MRKIPMLRAFRRRARTLYSLEYGSIFAAATLLTVVLGGDWVRDVKLISVVLGLMGLEIAADYLARYRSGRLPPRRLDKLADKLFSVILMVVCVAADYVFVTLSKDPEAQRWFTEWHPLTLGALGWAAIIEIIDIGMHVITAKQGRRIFPPLRLAVEATLRALDAEDDQRWPFSKRSPKRRKTDKLSVDEVIERVTEKAPELASDPEDGR